MHQHHWHTVGKKKYSMFQKQCYQRKYNFKELTKVISFVWLEDQRRYS